MQNFLNAACVRYQSDLFANEPAHEVMALFVLCKLILHMHLPSHPEPSQVAYVISTINSWAGSDSFSLQRGFYLLPPFCYLNIVSLKYHWWNTIERSQPSLTHIRSFRITVTDHIVDRPARPSWRWTVGTACWPSCSSTLSFKGNKSHITSPQMKSTICSLHKMKCHIHVKNLNIL